MKLRHIVRVVGTLPKPRPWHDGKHRHKSQGAAQAHIRAALKRYPTNVFAEYYCGTCKGWHVGNVVPKPIRDAARAAQKETV